MVTLKIYFQRPTKFYEVNEALFMWNKQTDDFKISCIQCEDKQEWLFIIRPVKASVLIPISVLEAFSAFAMCHLPEWHGEINLMQ